MSAAADPNDEQDSFSQPTPLGLALLTEERRLADLVASGVQPSRIRFNRAMALCARVAKEGRSEGRAGRLALETGVRLLGLMRSADVQPNEHTYGALVDACAKLGAADEARAVLAMMRDSGVAPNVVACSALLAALANRAAQGDRAAPRQVAAPHFLPPAAVEWQACESCRPGGESGRP